MAKKTEVETTVTDNGTQEVIGFRLQTTPDALAQVDNLCELSGLDRNKVITALIIHATSACAKGLSDVLITQAIAEHEKRLAAIRSIDPVVTTPMFNEQDETAE